MAYIGLAEKIQLYNSPLNQLKRMFPEKKWDVEPINFSSTDRVGGNPKRIKPEQRVLLLKTLESFKPIITNNEISKVFSTLKLIDPYKDLQAERIAKTRYEFYCSLTHDDVNKMSQTEKNQLNWNSVKSLSHLSVEFIRDYNHYFFPVKREIFSFTSLAYEMTKNPTFNMDILLDNVNKFERYSIDWKEISKHKNIQLIDIETHPDLYWDFAGVALNPNLTLAFVVRNRTQPWSWVNMNYNDSLALTHIKTKLYKKAINKIWHDAWCPYWYNPNHQGKGFDQGKDSFTLNALLFDKMSLKVY